MSKKANLTVIGGFVLGAVGLIVAAILVFGGGRLFAQRYRSVLFFDESVKGLGIGAPVLFKGVKIGQVTDILIRVDAEDLTIHIPVVIEIDLARMVIVKDKLQQGRYLSRLIEKGLRGQLAMQSFVTGQLIVDLDFHPRTPVRRVGIDMGLPELPTVPTPMEQLSRTLEKLPLREILERTAKAAESLTKVISSPEIENGVRATGEILKEMRELVRDVHREILPVLARANGTLADVQKLVQGVDSRVVSLSKNAEGAVGDARALVRSVDSRVGPLADRVDQTMRETQALMRRVDEKIDPIMTSIQDTARDAGKLMRTADENLGTLAKSLREASGAATVALEQARQTLGTIEGSAGRDSPLGHEIGNALREISAAARSLRVLSEYLEQHPDALLRGKGEAGGP